MTINRAIDLFIGELARRGRTEDTQRTYQRLLFAFSDFIGEKPLAEITVNDCRTFLDRWQHRQANTQNIVISAMRGLFDFLVEERRSSSPRWRGFRGGRESDRRICRS